MDPFSLALAAAVVLGAGTSGVVHHRRAKSAPRAGAPGAPGRTLLFKLAHAPFPAAAGPSVAVRVPPGWDPGAPLDLAVYFRGFGNWLHKMEDGAKLDVKIGGSLITARNDSYRDGYTALEDYLNALVQDTFDATP